MRLPGDYIYFLSRLCAQPSISATGEGIDQCAYLVYEMLNEYGYESEILSTAGNPLVFAQASGTNDKTLLFYLHYDVQPPEPFEAWESPPFELTRRGDKFFARGSADDKGHIIARLAGLAAVQYALRGLPCHVKFMVEGEEELGSPNMTDFINQNSEKLPAEARAKIDFRLVPNQTPEEILQKLRQHLDTLGFDDVEIQYNGGTRPARTDPDHPFVKLTSETALAVYGKEPLISPMIGGSGPNYPFIHTLNLPVVSSGIGYPGANAHK